MIIKTKLIFETIDEVNEAIENKSIHVGDEFKTTDIDGKAIFKVAHVGEKVWFVRKHTLKVNRQRKGLLEWLDSEYKESLPSDLRPWIYKNTVTLPSEQQVFGKNEFGEPEDGKQWDYFKNVKHRIASKSPKDKHSDWWWTLTRVRGVNASTSYFVVATPYGNGTSADVSTSNGVRPAFAI